MYINKPLLVHNLYLDGGLVYAIADDERAKILRVIGSMIEITPTLGINMKFINGMDDTAQNFLFTMKNGFTFILPKASCTNIIGDYNVNQMNLEQRILYLLAHGQDINNYKKL